MAEKKKNATRDLLESLFYELFQTEWSAEVHSPVEADRLGATPPARALRAVARHAQSVNTQLPALASGRGLPHTRAGRPIGRFFSLGRRAFSDSVMEAERSYRATLLGMRHGIDVVRVVRATAEALGDTELANWCTEWLTVRVALVEEVALNLEWFAWNAKVAVEHRGGFLGALGRWLSPAVD